MKKIIKSFICILAGSILMSAMAFANGSGAILETYTGDLQVSIYIKGAEADMEDVSIQIATTEAEQFDLQTLSELDKPMKTLVMLDNSLSISTKNRERIGQFLQNMISDRLNNEELSIATFGEEIHVLTDYSADYTTLKQAMDSISYEDQETYLTDVLYDLISTQFLHDNEDVYRRIIVISDGVDNKSLGYTKDELYSLLKEVPVPIYTVGCANKNNNDELENMFALSRMTSVDYFLLEEVEDLLEITEVLKKDRDIIKLTITPAVEMLDGSRKAVKISFADGSTLATEVVMPQQVKISKPEEIEQVVEEPAVVVEEVDAVSEKENTESTNFLFVFLVVLIVIVVVAIVCVVLIIKKKKNKQIKFETVDDNILKKLERNVDNINENTEIIGSSHNKNDDDRNTVLILEPLKAYQVVLTDINSPSKSFQAPLDRSIVVGRKAGLCDIVIDYEKTVSGRHCEISVKNNKFFVKDLQSSNHTYLNDNQVLTESEIFSGNILKLGRVKMRFEVRQ